MKGFVVRGKTARGRTGFIIDRLEELHRLDPFSYFLLGPTASFTESVRQELLGRGYSLLSDRFVPVWSLARQLASLLAGELRQVPEGVCRMELSAVVQELKGYVPSARTVGYFREAVNVLKENMGDLELAFGKKDAVPQILLEVYEGLRKRFQERRFFDMCDAFAIVAENADKIEPGSYGTVLFIDGFNDLSPAMAAFVAKFMESFESVYLTVPSDPDRRGLFREAGTLHGLFKGRECETIDLEDGYDGPLAAVKDSLFRDVAQPAGAEVEGLSVVECNDLYGEVDYVSRQIKRLIVEKGETPESFEIVVPGDDYLGVLKKRLADFDIPCVSRWPVSLLQSRSVRHLLLPFEVGSASFEPQKVIEMVDAGYGNPGPGRRVNAVMFEKIASAVGLLYSGTQESAAEAGEFWTKNLESYKGFLQGKRRRLEEQNDEGDDFSLSSLITETGDQAVFVAEKMLPAVKKIFSFLEPLGTERAISLQKLSGLFSVWWKQLGLEDLSESPDMPAPAGESLELCVRFLQKALPDHNRQLRLAGIEECSPAFYHRSLLAFLNSDGLLSERNMGGGARVVSLVDSRNIEAKYKFFMGFNDGNYPVTGLNPLYSKAQYSRPVAKDILNIQENRQRLGLFLAVAAAQERAIFTFSTSTIDGDSLLASPYTQSLLDAAGKSGTLVHGRDGGKRSDLIGSPARAMSRGDFKLSVARIFALDRETWDANATSDHMRRLEENLRRVPRPFYYNVARNDGQEDGERRCVSFSRISQYCGCKFKYFLSNVLKIEEVIEELLELSHMNSGSVFHAVLSKLPQNAAEIDTILDGQLRRYSSSENESLFRLRKKQMGGILSEYIAFDRERTLELNMRTEQTELAFGFGDVSPLELPGLCMRGFVDRVDVNNDDGTLFVIDYKSGKNTSSAHPEQLVLYSMAVEQAHRGEKRVGAGEFRLIKGKNKTKPFTVKWDQGGRKWVFGGSVGFTICETEKKGTITDEELVNAIRNIVAAIDAGDFSMTDWKGKKPNCFNCAYDKLCGMLEWRNRGVLSNER